MKAPYTFTELIGVLDWAHEVSHQTNLFVEPGHLLLLLLFAIWLFYNTTHKYCRKESLPQNR